MFKLYKQELRNMPFDDYYAIMHAVRGAPHVVEFGPGTSTLAMIEAGVEEIVSLEDSPKWLQTARVKFGGYAQVRLHAYENTPVICIDDPAIEGRRFAIAFVDAPVGAGKLAVQHPGQEGLVRHNTLKWALAHADMVLMHDVNREGEKRSIAALGGKYEMLSSRVARVWV